MADPESIEMFYYFYSRVFFQTFLQADAIYNKTGAAPPNARRTALHNTDKHILHTG